MSEPTRPDDIVSVAKRDRDNFFVVTTLDGTVLEVEATRVAAAGQSRAGISMEPVQAATDAKLADYRAGRVARLTVERSRDNPLEGTRP